MGKSKSQQQLKVPSVKQRTRRAPGGTMEVLLVQPVEHLGNQGDVVRVKRGYAVNYLFPQGLATIVSEHHKRMVEKHRAELEKLEKARLAELRALAEKLQQQSVTIEANANDEGHLYGSVGAADIVNALKRVNINLSQDQIRLKGPLKELGLYTIEVHLGRDIDTHVKVWVVPVVSPEEDAGGK